MQILKGSFHENIVKFQDFYIEEKSIFLIMEHCGGKAYLFSLFVFAKFHAFWLLKHAIKL